MAIRDVVQKFGGQTTLAALLGIGQSAVAYWVKRDVIPSKWHAVLIGLASERGFVLDPADLVGMMMPPSSPSRPPKELEVLPVNHHSDAEIPARPFMFYQGADGLVKVQVTIEDETIWASQRGMAEIFGVQVQTIIHHLGGIFEAGELIEPAVTRKYRATGPDGKSYLTQFYSLDAIISVGYRVNSHRATQFRIWATSILKEYMTKGFALDDDRLKQGKQLFGKDYFDELLDRIREIRSSERRFYQKITDIYAQCSVDYDPKAPITQRFYAHIQDKLHYAIHGNTAAELIKKRANANKPAMGLTHWKNEGKAGKITKADVVIGKNYLAEEELKNLEFLVSMYLDWATNLARRKKLMTMADWATKFDGFLEFNAYDVLPDYGSVTRDSAERCAIAEFDKFRVVQDHQYRSDFDRVVEEIKVKHKLPNRERN